MLLLDGHFYFGQSMGKAILVDLFQVAMTEVAVERKSGFTDLVTEFK
jgi:hypothetical protein